VAGLNKVMIIGYLGRDPEMRYTPNGSAVTSFSVGVSRQWTGQNGLQKETEWFNVETWSKLAEICNQSLAKGRLVYVEGRLRTRSWDGNDGQKKYRTELVAQTVQFLDSKGTRSGEPRSAEDDFAGESSSVRSAGSSAADDEFGGDKEIDDLPF
jgi:single-strand DNA-binding protein